MDPLISFINQLAEQLGISAMPQEVVDDFKNRMLQQLQAKIGILILNNLTPELQKEYTDMVTSQNEVDPIVVNDFIIKHIPNFKELVAKELESFVQSYKK